MDTKLIIYIIIVLLIIRILYIIKRKYDTKKLNNIYLDINGTPNNDFKKFIEFKDAINKKKENATSLDYYRLGSLYDYVRNDNKNASYYYKLGLQNIKKNTNDVSNKYVINKIQDRLDLNNFYTQNNYVEETPLENKDVLEIKQQLNEIKHHLSEIKDKDKIKTKWISDSQNVHDTNINQEIVKQFNELKNKIHISEWRPLQISNYIIEHKEDFPKYEQDKIPIAINMLDYINKYNPIIGILEISESIFIGIIFTYIINEKNETKKQIMLENFINNLYDMNPKNETPVCINGRITRALSTLAFPESNSDLGILKSKQVIQNEIFSRVGDLRKKILENTPQQIVNDYNLDKDTQEVINLKSQIILSIDKEILSDYKINGLSEIRKEIIDNI
jgi:hypothetical protein